METGMEYQSISWQKKTSIGVDLDATAIRVVALSRFKTHLAVDWYKQRPLESGWVSDSCIQNSAAVADALLQCFPSRRSVLKWRRPGAVFCIPSHKTIIRNVNVQAGLSDDELTLLVEDEVAKIMPESASEVVVDYLRKPASGDRFEDETVEMVICKKGLIDDLLGLTSKNGLTIEAIEVDVHALKRVYQATLVSLESVVRHRKATTNRQRRGAITLFIYIGSTTSQFMIFVSQEMVYQRDLALGADSGTSFEQDLSRTNYWRHEANAIQSHSWPASGSSPSMPMVSGRSGDVIADEVQRCLELFYSSSAHSSVDMAVLGGRCAGIPNFDGQMEKRLGVQVEILEPTMAGYGDIDCLFAGQLGPEFGLAWGLALGGL